MVPKNRVPTHPGEILLEEFLKPSGMSQVELAKKLSVPVQRINTLINGKRGITTETALLLALEFKTSPEFWMNLQAGFDLYYAQKSLGLAA
jgi:addiction module HigA family antidote